MEYLTCAQSIGWNRHNARVFIGGIADISDIEGLNIAVLPVRAHLALSDENGQTSPTCVYYTDENLRNNSEIRQARGKNVGAVQAEFNRTHWEKKPSTKLANAGNQMSKAA